jgi:anaerobic ribonucleoside-triphosphate reductase
MNIEAIPKIFWYAVSFAIIVISVGLIAIAYRSSNVTIEIANTKIKLSSQIEETIKLNEQIMHATEKYKQNKISTPSVDIANILNNKQKTMSFGTSKNNIDIKDLLPQDEKSHKMSITELPDIEKLKVIDDKLKKIKSSLY